MLKTAEDLRLQVEEARERKRYEQFLKRDSERAKELAERKGLDAALAAEVKRQSAALEKVAEMLHQLVLLKRGSVG